MSGEAVVVTVGFSGATVAVPVVVAATVGAVAMVAVGTLAAKMIEARRDELKWQAIQQRKNEDRRRYTLQSFEAFSALNQQRQNEKQQALLRLASFEWSDAPATAYHSGERVYDGYLNADQQQRARLQAVQSLFDGIPQSLMDTADSPFPRLQARIVAMQTQEEPLLAETVESFQLMLKQTIDMQIQHQHERQQHQQDLLERTRSLLDSVLTYHHLTTDPTLQREFAAIEALLEESMQAVDERGGSLDLLEAKAKELQAQVDQQIELQAAHDAAQERIHYHLANMGYQWLHHDSEGRDVWRIPGGDRITITLTRELRIGAQFQHERAAGRSLDAAMDADELQAVRTQERRWCGDLKQLIRQLVMDGFQYQINFERETPQESIPIVVVDDAASWEQDERTRLDAPKARYHS